MTRTESPTHTPGQDEKSSQTKAGKLWLMAREHTDTGSKCRVDAFLFIYQCEVWKCCWPCFSLKILGLHCSMDVWILCVIIDTVVLVLKHNSMDEALVDLSNMLCFG